MVGRGFEAIVAFPALAAFAEEFFSLFFDKVIEDFAGQSILNESSRRDFKGNVFAVFASAEIIAARLAVFSDDDASVTVVF